MRAYNKHSQIKRKKCSLCCVQHSGGAMAAGPVGPYAQTCSLYPGMQGQTAMRAVHCQAESRRGAWLPGEQDSRHQAVSSDPRS